MADSKEGGLQVIRTVLATIEPEAVKLAEQSVLGTPPSAQCYNSWPQRKILRHHLLVCQAVRGSGGGIFQNKAPFGLSKQVVHLKFFSTTDSTD